MQKLWLAINLKVAHLARIDDHRAGSQNGDDDLPSGTVEACHAAGYRVLPVYHPAYFTVRELETTSVVFSKSCSIPEATALNFNVVW